MRPFVSIFGIKKHLYVTDCFIECNDCDTYMPQSEIVVVQKLKLNFLTQITSTARLNIKGYFGLHFDIYSHCEMYIMQ